MPDKRVEPMDCDNFVIGNKDSASYEPLGFSLPKMLAYLKKTKKTFEELTETEISQCK